MLGRREMFESRMALVAVGLIGLCSAPVAAQTRERTIAIKEPTGWFGVRINDQAMVDENGNAFFDSYPVVTNVDPGSPAAQAGVKAGDVLLTFNSHDMRGGSIELAKWLRVGSPFVLRIRRNDAVRVLKGKLARRPDDWEQKMVVELTIPEIMERQSGSLSKVPQMRTGMMGVRSRMPSPEPLPMVLAPALGYGGGVYPFAGAEFTRLNQDLRDLLDVNTEGVFVTNVAEGSAARNAGLRGGDIILRADSITVRSPVDLVRAISAADDNDRTLQLQIIRKHKLQPLTLRW